MTKIPTEILKLAISGGWKVPHVESADELDSALRFYSKGEEWKKVALDREFWLALSKSLEWTHVYCLVCDTAVPVWGECKCDTEEVTPVVMHAWHYQARRFFDLILSGQDPTEFWAQLTK